MYICQPGTDSIQTIYWSRVTDLCIAYQSTVPFCGNNCCSGIIKHDRARILVEWLYKNIFVYVDGSVYTKTLFIAVVIFFATFNAHSCLLQAYYIYIIRLEIIETFFYLRLQLPCGSHTFTYIYTRRFPRVPATREKRIWVKK